MSKAFTRENDDFEEENAFVKSTLPSGARNYMTADGVERLRKELAVLTKRQQEYEVLDDAEDLREELRRTNARISALTQLLTEAEVVHIPEDEITEVRFGTFVTVRDGSGTEDEYRIVGVNEVKLEAGWISWLSPLAKALLGKMVGETVRLHAPVGERELQVVRISGTAPIRES
jgi:transcription elongation factor GreB